MAVENCDIEILKKMLVPAIQVEVDKIADSTLCIILREPQQGNKSDIIIKGIPLNSIIIKVEGTVGIQGDCNKYTKIFKGEHCNKMADYIIVSEYEERVVICYIELKVTKPKKDDNRKIQFQLLGSKCFMHYVKEIGNNFFSKEYKGKKIKTFLSNVEEHYFLLIATGRIDVGKRDTRANPSYDEKIYKTVKGSNVHWNNLISLQK